jgi:hypothetical protein
MGGALQLFRRRLRVIPDNCKRNRCGPRDCFRGIFGGYSPDAARFFPLTDKGRRGMVQAIRGHILHLGMRIAGRGIGAMSDKKHMPGQRILCKAHQASNCRVRFLLLGSPVLIPEHNFIQLTAAPAIVQPVTMATADSNSNRCPGCTRAKAYRLPLHSRFHDGRSAQDWHRSVISYLHWRAGAGWRPARHSGACVVDSYRDALHLVTQAYHTSSPPERRAGGQELKCGQLRRSLRVSLPIRREAAA